MELVFLKTIITSDGRSNVRKHAIQARGLRLGVTFGTLNNLLTKYTWKPEVNTVMNICNPDHQLM